MCSEVKTLPLGQPHFVFLADFNDKLTCWELNNVSSFSATTSTNSKILQNIDRFVLI